MKDYISVPEAAQLIASEVVQNGQSKNWPKVNENNLGIAREIESHLAKFNIGYTDPKNGSWSTAKGGSRYFSTMNMVSAAKSKMSSIFSSLTQQK
jgi:hypothetical protein